MPAPAPQTPAHTWPLVLLSLPAGVAIWSGWVGLGELTGFGPVKLLPGIWDGARINSAITLPIGVETYAAYALRVWLAAGPGRARTFARWSALGSLIVGAAGQIAYHLMTAVGMTHAPAPIVAAVACLPVAVLGMGAALAHLVTHDQATVHPAAALDTTPVQADTTPDTGADMAPDTEPVDRPAVAVEPGPGVQVDTGPRPLDTRADTGPVQVDTTPDTGAVRLDTAAARAAIEDAYRRGLSVREAAALSTRSASYVGQLYALLRDADTHVPGQLALVGGGQ